jgi:hypothetical protein
MVLFVPEIVIPIRLGLGGQMIGSYTYRQVKLSKLSSNEAKD